MPSSNPDGPHKGPPLTWRQLGEMLAVGGPEYHDWPEAPWLRFSITDNDRQSPRVRAYELTEAPYAKLLDTAVELWLRDKPLPELDNTAKFLLGLRFAVVGHLLMTFEDVGSLMPPAPEDEIGISRQFLVDWWRKYGAFFAVGNQCADFSGIAK